jgi:hypothetical protein
MAWFRKGRAVTPPVIATRPSSVDDPNTLRAILFELIRYINLNSGRIPGESVVTARRIIEALREVIDTSGIRPLDIYTVVLVKGILHDYLPTTLKSFLALDEGQLNVVRPSGRTPIASLQEQLESLLDAASSVLLATQAQDADAMSTQGNFLSTKFSRSDLDL